MSNKSNAKNANPIVNAENASIEIPALMEINLDKFQSKLNSIELKEKGISNRGNKEYLYNYPIEWNNDKNIINGLQGKGFRNKRRKEMESLSNNILFYAKGKKMDALKDAIQKFNANYKLHYRINDYKISSISNSLNDGKNALIEMSLEIIREMGI